MHKFIYIYTLYIYICTHLKVRHSVKELLISSINKVTTDFVGSYLEHEMTNRMRDLETITVNRHKTIKIEGAQERGTETEIHRKRQRDKERKIEKKSEKKDREEEREKRGKKEEREGKEGKKKGREN